MLGSRARAFARSRVFRLCGAASLKARHWAAAAEELSGSQDAGGSRYTREDA